MKVTEDGKSDKITLFIDNVEITKEMGYAFKSRHVILASIYDYELSKLAATISFQDIPENIRELDLFLPVEFNELIEEIEITPEIIRLQEKQNSFELGFEFRFDWEIWRQPWSITELAKVMEELVDVNQDGRIRWEQNDDEAVSNGFKIIFKVEDCSKPIYDVYEKIIPLLKEFCTKAVVLLLARSKKNSLIISFDFPEFVRVPCEQYLLYFSQFLKEVGIETITSLQQRAGKILFSVEPESQEVALGKIHEALEIFLNLPRMVNAGTGLQGQMTIPEQQLMANVQFLQGQLMLAKATIQAQDYTIQNQYKIIEQQNLINERVMQESLRYISDGKKIDDKETFFGGMVAIKKTDVKGVEIDTPKIYRWIKDKLKFQ